MNKKKKSEKSKTEPINSKNKLFIILGVIVAILIIIILAVYLINNARGNKKPTNEEEIINNTNAGVIGEQEIDGLTLTSTSLIYKDGISTLETTVSNNNDSAYYLEEFHIIVKDENGNDIINYTDEDGNTINYLVGYVGDEIPSKENRTIQTSIDFDITSAAYTITYKIAE